MVANRRTQAAVQLDFLTHKFLIHSCMPMFFRMHHGHAAVGPTGATHSPPSAPDCHEWRCSSAPPHPRCPRPLHAVQYQAAIAVCREERLGAEGRHRQARHRTSPHPIATSAANPGPTTAPNVATRCCSRCCCRCCSWARPVHRKLLQRRPRLPRQVHLGCRRYAHPCPPQYCTAGCPHQQLLAVPRNQSQACGACRCLTQLLKPLATARSCRG